MQGNCCLIRRPDDPKRGVAPTVASRQHSRLAARPAVVVTAI